MLEPISVILTKTNSHPSVVCVLRCGLGLMLALSANSPLVRPASAQTVLVDATPSHVVNTFRPLYALGTTVDRVPSNATDTFFRPDQVKQIVSAGWGVVSYRQNTEL